MTRVYAVVEGASEERFLGSVVVKHLATRSVWLYPMKVLRGGGARGGGSSWQPWQRHLRGLLRQHQGDDVRFTTMLDLYAIPRDTPGWTEPGRIPGPQRADAMLQAIGEQLQDRRLIPYIQVHEFETFLFAELTALAREAPDIVDERAFARLSRETDGVAPEVIDDGPLTASSKRIESCTTGFRKTIHGLQAVQAIGLSTLRQACPRFGSWLTGMEQVLR